MVTRAPGPPRAAIGSSAADVPGISVSRLASVISTAPASAADQRRERDHDTCQPGRVSRSSNSTIPRSTLTAGFETETAAIAGASCPVASDSCWMHEGDEPEPQQRPRAPVAGRLADADVEVVEDRLREARREPEVQARADAENRGAQCRSGLRAQPHQQHATTALTASTASTQALRRRVLDACVGIADEHEQRKPDDDDCQRPAPAAARRSGRSASTRAAAPRRSS